MTRIKSSVAAQKKHKKVLKLAKGYYGRSKNCFRIAAKRVDKGLEYAYRDRRTKKRDFRALWIQRINAAAREHGLTYSQFLNGLIKAQIEVDRKILADLAVHNKDVFKDLVEKARTKLA